MCQNDKLDGESLADVTSNSLNTGNSSKLSKDFVRAMSMKHKTLQQNHTRMCIEWINHLAKTQDYDLRNEDSVKFAKEVVKNVEPVYLYLKYI